MKHLRVKYKKEKRNSLFILLFPAIKINMTIKQQLFNFPVNNIFKSLFPIKHMRLMVVSQKLSVYLWFIHKKKSFYFFFYFTQFSVQCESLFELLNLSNPKPFNVTKVNRKCNYLNVSLLKARKHKIPIILTLEKRYINNLCKQTQGVSIFYMELAIQSRTHVLLYLGLINWMFTAKCNLNIFRFKHLMNYPLSYWVQIPNVLKPVTTLYCDDLLVMHIQLKKAGRFQFWVPKTGR